MHGQLSVEPHTPEAHAAITAELVRGTLTGDLRPELRYRPISHSPAYDKLVRLAADARELLRLPVI